MPTCDTCNKYFTLTKNLNRHMKNVHNLLVQTAKRSITNANSKHKCPLCKLIFVGRSSLRRHEKLKHKMYITPLLRNKKLVEYATFEPSNLDDYPLLKKLVPEDYVYKINHLQDIEHDKFKVKFEIADCTESVFLVWLSELSQKSEVIYKVKSFTKSPNPKIVFNKVFRCNRNTFPSKNCVPHSKHTGCLATLTVRIQKCTEALSIKNTMADNNVIMISLKAIITLYHNHNHAILKTPNESSSRREKRKTKNKTQNSSQCNETFTNHYKTDNNLYKEYYECNSQDNMLSYSHGSIKTYDTNSIEMFKETIKPNVSENNTFSIDDNITIIPTDSEHFELSDEFDDYILVENVNVENSLNHDDNENKSHQLLADYDAVNEKMLKQFELNPKYFMSAIKTYTSAMKNSLTSKESLLSTLHSFGKPTQEKL